MVEGRHNPSYMENRNTDFEGMGNSMEQVEGILVEDRGHQPVGVEHLGILAEMIAQMTVAEHY